MGLSASQARLLNLTRRMHDIEYKAQNLEAQKLQMANDSKAVYQEYEDALNATKMQQKYIAQDGSALFKDATPATLKDAGYAFEIAQGPSAGKVYPDFATAVTQLQTDKYVSGGTATNDNKALTSFVNAGLIVLVKLLDGDGKQASITAETTMKTLVGTDATKGSYEVNIATDTNLQEVTDDIALKKAEAKYEADMRKINQKDKKFDTDLAALEAERNAIKTEMETLKSVARDNVDRTYKLFS